MSTIPLAVKRRIIEADVRIRELEQQLADQRDSVIEMCAKVCDEAESKYNVAVRKETASFLALMIRAIKSQQDADIEAKPAEQSSDAWISVDEKVPGYPGTVLVAYQSDSDGEPCLDVGEAIRYPNGEWHGLGVFYALGAEPKFQARAANRVVTHWKHLPAPPADTATSLKEAKE